MGKDRNPDGVSTYPTDEDDIASYERAGDALSGLSTPVLLDSSRSDGRLFIAAFDGTGNSMHKDAPENHTNVAEVVKQLERNGSPDIGYGYVEGVGTQGGLTGIGDLIGGRT